MTERKRLQVQVSKMRCLQRIEGVTLFNKIHSFEIWKSLNIDRYFAKVSDSMVWPCKQNALGKASQKTLLAKIKGKKLMGRLH